MFDPQKMEVDEHIDLIDTLGDMLGQKDESKKDKFIDAMPTIIQMHLITEKDWAATTKKAKELEHIIRKCDPLAAALPTLAKGTVVPSLHSHIAHSNDKDETEIPQPFKGAHHKQPKPRAGGKGKQPQQKLKNPPYSYYYLDSQITDDFTCDQNCHIRTQHVQQDQTLTPFTHTYDHITQHVNNLEDPMQQHTLMKWMHHYLLQIPPHH